MPVVDMVSCIKMFATYKSLLRLSETLIQTVQAWCYSQLLHLSQR